MTRIQKAIAVAAAVGGLAFASSASAQLPFTNSWLGGPTVAAGSLQVNYPYAGQCVTVAANQAWGSEVTAAGVRAPLPMCNPATNAPSFACPLGGGTNQTAGPWGTCNDTAAPPAFTLVNPVNPVAQTKFQWEVLNPPDYIPDTTTYPATATSSGAHYYEIGVHEAWGVQGLANAGLFPNPQTNVIKGPAIPNGKQWTGIVSATGVPLLTPIWGVGQINSSGGPVTQVLSTIGACATALPPALLPKACLPSATSGPFFCTAAEGACTTFATPWFAAGPATGWSSNNYVATWPSISIRGTAGIPVVVKWVNEFPNNHLFCPHPEAADWPCAIDRTFMGVKATLDPAVAASQLSGVAPDGVNQFGSPQQPDNSWVTHLHGGEIPPSTDGFAEKWFGNRTTAPRWNDATKQRFVNPAFENPSKIELVRPAGFSDTYTYPMVQEEATIWFHDHTLGKTHHNVIAGPAGFFPVKEPAKHGSVTGGACNTANVALGKTCEYTWLDPVTEPRNALGQPKYDLFLALQDRSFNDDGSINFSNGLGQPIVGLPLVAGNTPFTPGANPAVHPTWIPEYFGDHAMVNGVIWPKATTEPGWYRIRLVDGSDSRCWNIGFTRTAPISATKPKQDIPFWIIANDQGYMKQPVKAVSNNILMCPGERYEILINFGALPGVKYPLLAPVAVYMTNNAAAPYPAGIAPFPGTLPIALGGGPNPFTEMNVVMRFDVQPATATAPGVGTCTVTGLTYPTIPPTIGCMPALNTALATDGPIDPNYCDIRPGALGNPATCPTLTPPIVRQVYLNERLDGLTLFPMGMQLNGVPFEYKVTETPKVGTVEMWQFINLTVDAHPMHPHLVRHQIVSRQNFNVGKYKAALCGSTTCQPGPAPGNEMQKIPDWTLLPPGAPAVLTTPASEDGGFKDATRVMPGQVTTIIADWTPRWKGAGTAANLAGLPNAPGTMCPSVAGPVPCTVGALPWTYEPVTSGPYVWHCHINSHEDSEMMRTSLVVK